MDETLLAQAEALLPEAVDLRRRIHAEPELGLDLPETQQKVLQALDGLALEIDTGSRISGVVATLRGGRPGPTILLRADMDALPMPEDTGLPFASKIAGRMHACGHDAHVAMLAGAARLLTDRREEVAGTVKFLFQPGEEGFGGARIMVEEGMLESDPAVGAAFAIHIDPTLPAGAVALRPGPLLAAADVFSIDLLGRGGHGSMPHHTHDPIPVACEIVAALQAFVARRMNVFDPFVVSVTKIEAGSTNNVIPEAAHLLGTIRTFSKPSRELAHESLQRIAKGVAAAHECEATVHIAPGYPVTVNDAGFAGFTRDVAATLLGEEHVIDMPAPIMGAEDFSYILERVPGAMVFLGVRVPGEGRPAPIHSNRMQLEEAVMARGIALHAAMALAYGRAPAPA